MESIDDSPPPPPLGYSFHPLPIPPSIKDPLLEHSTPFHPLIEFSSWIWLTPGGRGGAAKNYRLFLGWFLTLLFFFFPFRVIGWCLWLGALIWRGWVEQKSDVTFRRRPIILLEGGGGDVVASFYPLGFISALVLGFALPFFCVLMWSNVQGSIVECGIFIIVQ